MIVWPRLGVSPAFADAEPVAAPAGEAFAAWSPAPPLGPALDASGPGALCLDVDPPVAGRALSPQPRRLRRRWLLAAALLSGAAHAAAIFALVSWLDLRSVEAETDEVSVEIVIEPPQTEGVAAGQPDGETQATETAAPSGFLPPDPFAPRLAQAPAFPEPVEPPLVAPDLPPALDGPPKMPPVEQVDAPAPETLAVLAAPPVFEPVSPPVARPEPRPGRETAKKPLEQPQAKPERAAKPEAKRQQAEPQRRQAKNNAETPAKATRKADAGEKPETRRGADGGREAAGVSGKGAGDGNRKAGEIGKVASAASGGVAQYGAQVNRQVQRNRRYPAEAQRAGISGVVRVSIRIDSSGRLTAASIRASSGHDLLDREALATVRRASPFPKPPAGVAPASFSLSLRFSR